MTEEQTPILTPNTAPELEPAKQVEIKLEPACPLCEAEPIMLGIGIAHAACEFVIDPTKKADCRSWIDNIKPEEIKSVEEVYEGILDHAGLEETHRTIETQNMAFRNMIIKRVARKLQAKETVPEMEMVMYRLAVNKNMEQGG